MWRLTVLLCLLIFYGHTSSQPVTDDSENARQARQLDYGECCPCPRPGQGLAAQESSMPSDGMLGWSRDIDDCPCRPRSSDSEGASSMFFPTSRRSDDFLRPAGKKEDIKPLLHPEVDLASSVLQTLREATEEEYEDALARDAARSMAKAAEETIFGDALPEASNGNIVTIIVNPKHSDSFEDGVPQESHVQESRCIHTPLESGSSNIGEMRVAQKSPNLLRDIFGLPRINKPAGLLHKNLLDMDNGASNVQERVLSVDDDKLTNKNVLVLRKYFPMMKFDTNLKDKSTNVKTNVDIESNVKTVPDFKLPPLKKLKDLLPIRPALEGKEKPNSLSSIPKMRFNNTLLKVKGKDTEDLSLSPSNIHEQAKKSFFQTKSHLENFLQHTKPVGLKTLLKLKDVEFVPLKDLVPKAAEKPTLNKPKFAWPDIFKKGHLMKNPINIARSTEIIETIPKSSLGDVLDAEVSPSNVIEQVNDDNCINTVFKTTETDDEGPKAKTAFPDKGDVLNADLNSSNVIEQVSDDNCINTAFEIAETDGESPEAKTALSDTIDAASSPSEILEIVNDTSYDVASSQLNELPDNTEDCDVKTLQDTESNLPQSMESSSENEAEAYNDDELIFETSKEIVPVEVKTEEDQESQFISNDEDCASNTYDGDSITDSSNNIIDVLKPNVEDLLVNQTPETQEPCSKEQPASDATKILDINPTNLIKPLSLDKTLSRIKENIRKHIESFQIPKQIPKVTNIIDEPTPSDILIENKGSFPMTDGRFDSDCQNEESIQVTTVKPDICDDELKIESEPDDDKVSMQDLQKISDDMLKEEQERESKTLNCSEPTQKFTNSKIEVNSAENENIDAEQSANTQNEVIMDSQNNVDISENNNDINNIDAEQSANTQNEVIMDRQNNIDVNENNNGIKNACKIDLMLPKQSFEQESDANVEASEVIMSRIPKKNKMFSSPLLLNKVLQPNENDFSLKIPLPDLQDIKLAPLPTLDELKLAPLPTLDEIKLAPLPTLDEMKLAPLPTLDEIKLGFTNLFDTPARGVEEHSALEAASMTDTSNILAPTMSTDASLKHFQSLLPPLRLEDVDLDILQLSPQSNLFSKIPKFDLHSFRTKLPLPTDLRIKPLKLQSAFEDNGGLLGATLSLGQKSRWENIPGLDDFGTRMRANTNKIAKTLHKPDLRLKSSQRIGDLSGTNNSFKSMHHSLESKIRGATTKPVNLQSNDLLEAISRNHEDVNDKLRALHIDFNDRLETMRNNLFDKSVFGSGESRNTKSFSTFSTKDKISKLKTAQPLSLTSRRESKKKLQKQKDTRIASSQNKFKMPTSASVPVPRTIQVPELKATLTKSPGLGIQRSRGVNPIFQNIDATPPKESTITLWKQASKKLPITNTRLGKTINPFKDSKIKVSFSTTPLPILPSRFQTRKLSTPSLNSNLGRNTGRLGQRLDHSGSPSEIRHSIISPQISSQLAEQNSENFGLKSESKQSALPTLKFGGKENLEQPKLSKDLQSWPKVSESAFLSKVKEAVKARMSKVTPATFKKADIKSGKNSVIENGEVRNLNTDMSQSASTNVDVVEGKTLKENVSYKCTMVCTKE